jgi:DUF1680 family protein
MNRIKALAMALAIGTVLLVGTFLISGCGSTEVVETDIEPQVVQTAEPGIAFSFEDAAVELPSPASVQLDPAGRLGERFQGNIKYVRHLHKVYGEWMIEAFATRHYSPGKLLERVWDGEYAGKWLDSATRTAVNTGDDAQLAMVDTFAASLRQHQQPDGYMGIKLPTDRTLNGWEQAWDVWVQWNAMIGFLTHYELRGERASLEAASGVGDWIVKTYSPVEDARFLRGGIGFTNIAVIGQLVRLYRHTGNEDLLEFVGQVIRHYPPIQQMLSSGEPFLVHPYMLSAVLGGVLEYAQVTKDYEMLARVEQVWDGLVNDHLFPTGSLGDREDLHEAPLKDTPGGQLQETCATTEWIFFTQSLYTITGRAKYVEALELTCYNALLAAQSADGMKWCYWTPLRYSKDWFHGPTRCCFWSGPKGIARLPQLIYAIKGNVIYVNFFETSSATLNTTGGQVHVTQDSKFPEIGKGTVTLETPSGWNGTLQIRIPSWAKDFQIRLNEKLVTNSSDVEGYFGVNLQNSREQQIEIQFDIPLFLDKFEGNDYVIRRGPEVLSVDIRDNIDTWLGEDDLITIPKDIQLEQIKSYSKHQWPGPTDSNGSRRRYGVSLNDARTSEPRSVILTPYADAGNEGAAFRTVFPLAEKDKSLYRSLHLAGEKDN